MLGVFFWLGAGCLQVVQGSVVQGVQACRGAVVDVGHVLAFTDLCHVVCAQAASTVWMHGAMQQSH
jgi:hypothetical protein